jgi:predicted RNA methylase
LNLLINNKIFIFLLINFNLKVKYLYSLNMDIVIINKIFPMISDNKLLKYDTEGLWSISLPNDAHKISLIILSNYGSNLSIFDGTAGIGGNVISFAKFFNNVYAIELDKNRFEILKNNINIYQLNNIILINDDSNNHLYGNYDIYFFDPPWGGKDYKNKENLRLCLSNYTLNELINKIKNYNNKPIIFKLPNNYDLSEFSNYNYNIIKIKNYMLIIIN